MMAAMAAMALDAEGHDGGSTQETHGHDGGSTQKPEDTDFGGDGGGASHKTKLRRERRRRNRRRDREPSRPLSDCTDSVRDDPRMRDPTWSDIYDDIRPLSEYRVFDASESGICLSVQLPLPPPLDAELAAMRQQGAMMPFLVNQPAELPSNDGR